MKLKTTGFIVSHGHMDIEWYMPLHSYRFWTVEALDELITISKENPDFVTYVLDGVTYVLDIYLKARPKAKKAIKELINDGKLSVGPFFTQFDEWLTSPESIVRNCLYGNRKCREYGKIMKAGYLPDNFGHPQQLPQILNNFGLDSLLFMRGMPEIPGGHPDEFIYIGLDGSKVLASHFRDSYGGAFNIHNKNVDPMQPRDMPYHKGYYSYEYYQELADHTNLQQIALELISNVRSVKERYPSGIVPLIAGCDHCPPQSKLTEIMKLANNIQDEIDFVMGNAEDYIRAVQARISNPMEYDRELIGSFYQFVLLGALSTRSYIKRQNFAAEAMMERYAEPLDAIASMLGNRDTQTQLDEAWENLMVNSAHDSIHGSSIDEVHVEMEARYSTVRQIASGLSHDAFKHIGKYISPWWQGCGRGILAFAPSDPGEPQLGQIWLPVGDESVCICDQLGNALPTQVMPREEIELNSIGKPRNTYWPPYKLRNVLFLLETGANQIKSLVCKAGEHEFSNLTASDGYIENEHLRVEAKGALIDILDKDTGRWHYGLNLIEENEDAGDAWDYSPAWTPGEKVLSNRFAFTTCLIETGPVRATLMSQGKMNVPSRLIGDTRSNERVDIPVSFEITLERYLKRVDVKLTLENHAKDHRMRLRIPTGVKTDTILSQGHFGILRREINKIQEVKPWIQPPTPIMPFREWVAADDGQNGIAIAVKGIYDYEAVVNTLNHEPDIYLTLVRGFEYMSRINTIQRMGEAARCHHTPGAQCMGTHVIEWSYIPYKASVKNAAPFLPLAHNFLYPMMTHMVRVKHEEDTHGPEFQPFAFLNENVQFSAFKQAHDRNGYILRFFENQGCEVETRIRLAGFNKVFRSNMNEEVLDELDMKDSIVTIKAGAYKVVTLLLTS